MRRQPMAPLLNTTINDDLRERADCALREAFSKKYGRGVMRLSTHLPMNETTSLLYMPFPAMIPHARPQQIQPRATI